MTSYEHFDLNIDEVGIAWLTIDVKGRSANVLSHAVMAELFAIVDGLAAVPPAGGGIVQPLDALPSYPQCFLSHGGANASPFSLEGVRRA